MSSHPSQSLPFVLESLLDLAFPEAQASRHEELLCGYTVFFFPQKTLVLGFSGLHKLQRSAFVLFLGINPRHFREREIGSELYVHEGGKQKRVSQLKIPVAEMHWRNFGARDLSY